MGYQMLGRLGRGGMGVVDLAVDEHGRQVAAKRLSLHGSAADMVRSRQRIRREAEVLQRLDHPGIVGLIEVVDDGDDLVLVMPYLSGGTLGDRVATSGPLPSAEVTALLDQLLDALAAAHRQGIVHRDIKPANVLFDERGGAHLADFGVALSRDATPGLTATDLVVGTPGFMAPEQARGEPAGPASDVFALGATLAYAATGTPPFGTGDPRVLMHRAAEGRVERLPRTLDPALRRRLVPLLDRNPARRPTAAAARGGPAGTAVRAPSSRRRRRRPHRGVRRGPLAAAGALAVALLVVAGGVTLATRDRDGDGQQAGGSDASPSSAPCAPLPFQPCGQEPAPGTDGIRCLADRADYDGDAANGCEAVPDVRDGAPLVDVLSANLVPDGDVDRYPLTVVDNAQLLCNGTLRVTLTAPAEVGQLLEVLDTAGATLGEVTSFDGESRTVSIAEPRCFGDDSTTLEVLVSQVGDGRSADDYTLEVSGSF